MTSRKLAVGALLLVLLAAITWLAWCGASAAVQARLALADLKRIQAVAGDPSPEALPALRSDLGALESHLSAAERAGRPLLWGASRLGWLPGIGPTVQAAPVLLSMGIESARAGQQAMAALAPVIDQFGRLEEGELLARVVPALAGASSELAAADRRLARVQEMRATLPRPLHPRLAGQLERLDRALPLARTGLQAARVGPALLGADGPRTYLILVQNSDELRATGGFISAVGVLELDDGRVTGLKLADSYAVDNWQQPHPAPPRALAEYMGAQLLVLRDSNWSPDFPTSAEVARVLYQQDQGVPTDGAIALDLEAVRLLVAALGPLEVPGLAEPVTAANLMSQLKQAWEAPATSEGTIREAETSDWWLKRKDFMGEMVGVALTKLQSGVDLNFKALASALLAMLEGRHLQIAVDDPAAAALFSERGWDGGFRRSRDEDFLAVVDSNVGFNKANAAVNQEIAYAVAPAAAGGRIEASLTLTYTHTSVPLSPLEPCDHTPRYGDSYDDLIRRCYRDYLRVYVPSGSELMDAGGLANLTSAAGEGDTTGFAGDFELRPGAQHVVTLRYRLPAGLAAEPYRLSVRKQAGTGSVPLWVKGGECRWETTLDSDRRFECAVVGQ